MKNTGLMKFLACLARLSVLSVIFFSLPDSGFAAKTSDKQYQGYNVIMIVVDCLRADHLACYGYIRNSSPNIDKFKTEGLFFTQAITQAPTTLLSFASFLTSQYVSRHGVSGVDRCLRDDELTLPKLLKIFDYQTAAFLGGPLLDPIYKLNQGFDTYSYNYDIHSSFALTFPQALAWAQKNEKDGKKFFMLIHGNDLHESYASSAEPLYGEKYYGRLNNGSIFAPDKGKRSFLPDIYKKKVFTEKTVIPLDDKDIKYMVAQYDTKIRYIDGLIGNFLSELKKSGLSDKTIVILTADHGEGLFDHDYYFHEFNLYETTINVPLIIKIPGCKAKKISSQVQLIDLMPTILDLLGIKSNNQIEGKSIVHLFYPDGRTHMINKYIFTESTFGAISVRSNDGWKLIEYPEKTELFDLNNDPHEKINLADQDKETVLQMQKILHKWREMETLNTKQKTADILPPDETIRQIKNMIKTIVEITPERNQRFEEMIKIKEQQESTLDKHINP